MTNNSHLSFDRIPECFHQNKKEDHRAKCWKIPFLIVIEVWYSRSYPEEACQLGPACLVSPISQGAEAEMLKSKILEQVPP